MRELIDIAILQRVLAIKSGLCLNKPNGITMRCKTRSKFSQNCVTKQKRGIGKANDSNTFFLSMFHFDPPAITVGGRGRSLRLCPP